MEADKDQNAKGQHCRCHSAVVPSGTCVTEENCVGWTSTPPRNIQ